MAVRPLAALIACLAITGVSLPDAAIAKPVHKAAKKTRAKPKPKAPELPETMTRLASWVAASGDNRDMPYVIVDKANAQVAVYDASGKLLGSDTVLTGSAPGDESAPGVGDRELSDIPMEERTTPAGRFIGAWGPAAGHDRVLWVDYTDAISIHPVITSNVEEKRLERLKTKTPDDNRITHGCINVPTRFYSRVVAPTFAGSQGVFYILPDSRPVSDVFPEFYMQTVLGLAPQEQANSEPEAQPAPSGRL